MHAWRDVTSQADYHRIRDRAKEPDERKKKKKRKKRLARGRLARREVAGVRERASQPDRP